jgi:23S rRNA (guanosine2251-2'-O)-methyltransferase
MRERPPRGTEQRERGERSERHVYGVNPVLEALRVRADEVERLYITEGQLGSKAAAEILSRARDAGIRVERVPRERLASLAEGGVHQGVVAELRGFQYAEVADLLEAAEASGRPPLIVVLDGIQDPHNLGAIIRSAHALGAHGVVIGKDRAVPVTGLVAKASAGAVEHCPIARVVNISRALEELKEAGVWVAAADIDSPEPLWKARLDGPLAIVVGAEGAGVREGVLKHCDFRLRIPMAGQVGSLNASVSAAILLYEVARQRGGGVSGRSRTGDQSP